MERVFSQHAYARKRIREFEEAAEGGIQNTRGFKSYHLLVYLSRYVIQLEQKISVLDEDRKYAEDLIHHLEGRVEELESQLKRKKDGADTLMALSGSNE
jgi:hypothetical protein